MAGRAGTIRVPWGHRQALEGPCGGDSGGDHSIQLTYMYIPLIHLLAHVSNCVSYARILPESCNLFCQHTSCVLLQIPWIYWSLWQSIQSSSLSHCQQSKNIICSHEKSKFHVLKVAQSFLASMYCIGSTYSVRSSHHANTCDGTHKEAECRLCSYSCIWDHSLLTSSNALSFVI